MLLRRGRGLRPRQWVAGVCAVTVLVAMVPLGARFERQSNVALSAVSVAVGEDGQTLEVHDGALLVPGYRVLRDHPDSVELVAQQQAWLDEGTVPYVSEVGADLPRGALLDVHVLSLDYGVTVAGRSPRWRYVWPRDTAFVASALARTGHTKDALQSLDFLQRVQPASGLYEARYLPDGSGVPDSRGVQLDGTGWALWALAEVVRQQESPAARTRTVQRYRQLLDRAATATLSMVSNPTGLPPASSDYWEVKPAGVSLATCSVLLAGMVSAVYLYEQIGDSAKANSLRAAAGHLETEILQQFGPTRYSRYLGGSPRSVDLGVTFLLPPFAGVTDAQAREVWSNAPRYMRRPAGGLAPGGSWRRDGISWTPTVSAVAVTAACIDPDQAVRWLNWIAAHRTISGSIPEKVLANGQPASVTPLAWSAAAVIIAVDELQHGCTK